MKNEFETRVMTPNCLTVFQFKRSTYIFLTIIVIPILIITFFVYGFIAYLIKPVNTFLIGISFFGTMLGMSYLLVLLSTKLLYKDIAQIYYFDNKIIIKKNNNSIEEYKNDQIESIKFYYRGDIGWRAINPKFQKKISRQRYRSKMRVYSSGYGIELDSFDTIIINSTRYLVKIKDFPDKEYFYKIVDWAEKYEIKYDLIEENYYAEFK